MTLKAWRKKFGIPLAVLAGDVGCTSAALSYIENGKRTPSMDMALRIVKATKGAVALTDLARGAA